MGGRLGDELSWGDRIEVRDLRVSGVHGVLPSERERAQPFAVDVDAWLDTRAAAFTEALVDTVDYGALVDRCARVVAEESFALLETLAGTLADAVLHQDDRIEAVSVTVRKLRPPLPHELGSVGVRSSRRRAVYRGDTRHERVLAPVRRAFLGLGSNVGDRFGELQRAVATLARRGDLVAVSPVYETAPVGGPEGQADYLNAVVELKTADSPRRLLERCRMLEEQAGRVRGARWGPRTLDADVLLVGDEAVDEPDLHVPHPRMWERRFVVAPLRDLAPELVPAGAQAAAGGKVKKVGTIQV